MSARIFLAAVVGLAGCSSGSASIDASSALDLGAADMVSSQCERRYPTGVDAPALRTGIVTLYSPSSPQIAESSTAFAFFAESSGAVCAETVMGSCRLVDCSQTQSGTFTLRSAGTMTVSGGPATLTWSPMSDASYPDQNPFSGLLWLGGDTVTLSAAGADVPAFTTRFDGPRAAPLTQPTPPSPSAPLTIDRATDFTVKWDPKNSVGFARVSVGQAEAPNGSVAKFVECEFEGAAGAGTIPAALLQPLASGAGSLAVTQSCARKVQAGDFEVVVDARAPSLLAQTGSVTLQ